MGVGPIPRSKAMEYAIESGIDDVDDRDTFWQIISALDNENLKQLSAKMKKRQDEPAADLVSADDTEGMKRVMKSLGSQHKVKAKH